LLSAPPRGYAVTFDNGAYERLPHGLAPY
jgi:hypothetical protein